MKKMRGVVDPISLGFIISALIVGVGTAKVAKNEQAEAKQAQVAQVKYQQNQQVKIHHAINK